MGKAAFISIMILSKNVLVINTLSGGMKTIENSYESLMNVSSLCDEQKDLPKTFSMNNFTRNFISFSSNNGSFVKARNVSQMLESFHDLTQNGKNNTKFRAGEYSSFRTSRYPTFIP